VGLTGSCSAKAIDCRMDYLLHIMEVVSEYNRHAPRIVLTEEQAKQSQKIRGFILVLIIVVGSIFLAGGSVFFSLVFYSDGNLPILYLVNSLLFNILFVATAIRTGTIIWLFFVSKRIDDTFTNVENDLEYEMQAAKILLALSLIPFVHAILFPKIVSHCLNAFEISELEPELSHQKKTINNIFTISFILFELYNAVIGFSILIYGNSGKV
jgi:hypothetical protein